MTYPMASPQIPSLRPPQDGECECCGYTPAVRVTFQSVASLAIIYSVGTRKGWMCRSCGLATFRQLVGRTLLLGWWGVGLFAIPVILLANALRLRRVLRLPAPLFRLPEVTAPAPMPLDPGRPMLARGTGIFGLVITALLLGSVVLVAVSS